MTGNQYDLVVWSGSEIFAIIVCGSIPPSKPLWDMCFQRVRRRIGVAKSEPGRSDYGGSRPVNEGYIEMLPQRTNE
jgi:hypothetical protein